ncbi:MAG: hypothetical protein JO006_03855 [Paucibacter sp.]|nr:hypothetical protein [Roseateles sp.]
MKSLVQASLAERGRDRSPPRGGRIACWPDRRAHACAGWPGSGLASGPHIASAVVDAVKEH